MTKKNRFSFLATGIIGITFCALSLLSDQDTVDYGEILGTWEMEVDAGGEFFYLSFSIEKSEEGLKGFINESSGLFSQVPLENVEFDGTNLSFQMNIPTPPDGYENLVMADLELAEGTFTGTVSVDSLGISAAARATKRS